MLMLSCRVTLTCVIVTVACVASVCRVSPRTLALETKLDSHSALSPVDRGGISAGGAAGSNVRLAKATGCLVIVGAEVSPACRRDDELRHASHPRTSPPSNKQSTMSPREGKATSTSHFPNK